ncbi:MAG TPA: hypothetical protein VFT22_38360 [Kofleriaceae bacterium]|nr:hypothetical protein [Kofleriaceae bacterium]
MNRITLITFGLSIAACTSSSPSSSSSSPATDADYEDTAQAIASSTATGGSGGGAGDAVAIADALSIARGVLPLGFLRGADGRIHGTRMGVDNSFMITCKDASGAVLARCDMTTDSATVDVKWTGNLQTPNLTASVDREGTWTITGIASGTATVNGDSSFSLDTQLTSIFHQGVTSTFSYDATASYDAITVAIADRQITGGSASFEVKAHRTVTGTPMGSHDVDKSFDVTAELTFNGDHTATLTLDGTRTFTIDLSTGKVTRVL